VRSLVLIVLSGCQLVFEYSGDRKPEDFLGSYVGDLVNKTNDCRIVGLTPGMTHDIDFELLGDASSITLTTENVILGALLINEYGSNTFAGEIQGDLITFDILNPDSAEPRMSCPFRARLEIDGTLDDGVLRGSLIHTMVVETDESSCDPFAMCQSIQTYVATRLPN